MFGGIVLGTMAARRVNKWPDTVIMAVTFGTFAVIVAVKARMERDTNRRLWNGLKDLARRLAVRGESHAAAADLV